MGVNRTIGACFGGGAAGDGRGADGRTGKLGGGASANVGTSSGAGGGEAGLWRRKGRGAGAGKRVPGAAATVLGWNERGRGSLRTGAASANGASARSTGARRFTGRRGGKGTRANSCNAAGLFIGRGWACDGALYPKDRKGCKGGNASANCAPTLGRALGRGGRRRIGRSGCKPPSSTLISTRTEPFPKLASYPAPKPSATDSKAGPRISDCTDAPVLSITNTPSCALAIAGAMAKTAAGTSQAAPAARVRRRRLGWFESLCIRNCVI